MRIALHEGKIVIIVVCPRCAHTIALAPPRCTALTCARCGERIEAPDAEATTPA